MPEPPASPGPINRKLRYRPPTEFRLDELWTRLQQGERSALAQAITLVESSRETDRARARELINRADRLAGPHTFRLGISGSPGVGKSTFIEAFGLELIRQGYRLAVLAIDPSSSLSGGSILGDKTRMQELGRHPAAFIRPSPSGGKLGGVQLVTRESMLLCEAAGYDLIIVETVGVGQSELAVHGMTDAFLLLAQPAAGDELQGIKRGVLEMADLLVVNKVDALPQAARQTATQLRQALHLAPARPDGWQRPILTCAALTGQYIDQIRSSVEEFRQHLQQGSYFATGRERQRSAWLHDLLRTELLRRFEQSQSARPLNLPAPGAVYTMADRELDHFFKTQTNEYYK